MSKKIHVSLGEVKTTGAPNILISTGLGSCIALCFYAPERKLAGMAHVMLPGEPQGTKRGVLPGRYVYPAISYLLNRFKRKNVRKENIVVKVIGGANLFHYNTFKGVGKKNIESVKKALREEGMEIAEEDLGGKSGRSIWFFASTGEVRIKKSYSQVKNI